MEIESRKVIGLDRRAPRRVRKTWLRKAINTVSNLPVMVLSLMPFIFDGLRAEARSIRVTRRTIELAQLPVAFDGMTLAFLTDWHCSAQTPPEFLERVVAATNELKPDLILLGGDYITEGLDYIRPVQQVLRPLHASLGVYAVLGNHDYWVDRDAVAAMLQEIGIVDVTNSGRWITRGGSRLRIAGVGDLWEDRPDLHAALAGVKENERAILLSHNPDFVMRLRDPRVGLVLSGHTHGGQIHLPRLGPVITNSRYGRRLVGGLVAFDTFQVYVSRGLGTVMVPMRRECPPEIALLTLRVKAEPANPKQAIA
jgi:uncharacterized protein